MSEATSCPERWAPVLGYEGFYEVSDAGRVRSLDRIIAWNGTSKLVTGRILRGAQLADGKRRVPLCRDGGYVNRLVHVLVLEAFVGPRPPGLLACHNNDVPTDNRLDNLRWDTPSSNQYDKVAHGNHYQTHKTHCPLGHALVVPNLSQRKWETTGRRSCRSCGAAAGVVHHAKKTRRPIPDRKAVADDYYARYMSGAA